MSDDTTMRLDGAASPKRTRERSAIPFPYEDLGASLTIVRVAHEIHGGRCEADQVAAALGSSPTSGAFRMKVAAARMFGFLAGSGSHISVTELGTQALDERSGAAARATGFLNAPLYKALHERFRGRTLPPDAGLTAALRDLGVPEKQAEHARRVFQRSAEAAGFFLHGRDRLVMPPVVEDAPADRPEKREDDDDATPPDDRGEWMTRKPSIIAELFRRLPDEGQAFEDRDLWMKAFTANLDLVYRSPERRTDSTPVNGQGETL